MEEKTPPNPKAPGGKARLSVREEGDTGSCCFSCCANGAPVSLLQLVGGRSADVGMPLYHRGHGWLRYTNRVSNLLLSPAVS